jgi:flagellar biosynthetic protein FlhB
MSGERTEQATPKRLSEAREKGQILKSTEINTAVLLIGGAWLLQWSLPGMTRSIMDFTVHVFETAAVDDFAAATVRTKSLGVVLLLARLVGPLLGGLAGIAVLVNIGQFGFLLSGNAIKPQFSRVNPMEGAKRIFSGRTLVVLIKTVVKVSVIGLVAWQALQDKGSLMAVLADMQPGQAAATITATAMGVVWKTAGAFVVIAIADYVYQRWSYDKNMRMSRDEIKEEMKQTEGDPQIRGRLRQRARALARQRMMQQVPKADVVVTNPTHFAVALKYEEGMAAPVVIAKGQNLIAQQIKKVAREHGVPTVENKPLAQALYKSVDLGQPVPADLFKAVAEVLAFVYRLQPHRAPAGYRA